MNACSLSTSIALTVLGSFQGREENESDNVFLANALHLASLGAICSGIWVNVKQRLLPPHTLYMGLGASVGVPLALRGIVYLARYTGVCVAQAESLENGLGRVVDVAALIASVAALALCGSFLQQAYVENIFYVLGSTALVGVNVASWLGLLRNN